MASFELPSPRVRRTCYCKFVCDCEEEEEEPTFSLQQQQAPAKVQVPKKGPCKVHRSGRKCEDGIFCKWSHEKLSPCKYFLQGNCTRGGCQFPHIGQAQQAPQPQPKKPCRTIAEGRECPYGDRCHFAH